MVLMLRPHQYNTLLRKVVTMIASVKPITSSEVPTFESMLPVLTIRFRKAALSIKSYEERTDAVAEMIGLAYGVYASLVKRGRTDIFSSPIGEFAVKGYFSGRRVSGMSATDVTSPRCRFLGRSTVVNEGVGKCICRRTFKPSTIGAFNIDFTDWKNTLDDRTQNLLSDILMGETTSFLARRYEISPARISQIRRELVESWHDFVSDHHEEKETK